MRVPLLHGFAGSAASWEGVIAAWHGPKLVPLTLPGHGAPVLPTWSANLDALDLEGARVAIGYSFGARIALGLVAAGRLDRAVLIGVNPGISEAERPARRAGDAAWVRLLREQGIEAFVDAWQAQPLFASQARVPADRLAERRARRLALDPEQLARCLEVMGLAEMPDYRSAVDTRCQLIAGAEDTRLLAIARALPAPVEVVEESGHDPTLEQPLELAELLERVLAKWPVPGGSTG